MAVAFPWLVVSGCYIAKILCAHSTAVVSEQPALQESGLGLQASND